MYVSCVSQIVVRLANTFIIFERVFLSNGLIAVAIALCGFLVTMIGYSTVSPPWRLTISATPDLPFDHFSLVAPLYERVIRPPDAHWLRELCAFEPGHRLLDVGGGTGRVSQHFRGDVASICILDVSVGMLREALSKGGFCAGSGAAEWLPFRDGAFERIIAIDSFHHFRNHRRAAGELLRVLAPGGRLVIEEPDIRRFRVKLVALGETLALMRSHFYPPHALMRFFDVPGVQLTLRESSPNFWLVVEKPPEHHTPTVPGYPKKPGTVLLG